MDENIFNQLLDVILEMKDDKLKALKKEFVEYLKLTKPDENPSDKILENINSAQYYSRKIMSRQIRVEDFIFLQIADMQTNLDLIFQRLEKMEQDINKGIKNG